MIDTKKNTSKNTFIDTFSGGLTEGWKDTSFRKTEGEKTMENEIQSIRKNFNILREKSEEKKNSVKSLIDELADDIRDLRKRGVSFTDILNAIKGVKADIKLSESTLKRYLYESSPKKKTRKKSAASATPKTEQHTEQKTEQKEVNTEQKTEQKAQTVEHQKRSDFPNIDDDEV